MKAIAKLVDLISELALYLQRMLRESEARLAILDKREAEITKRERELAAKLQAIRDGVAKAEVPG